MRTSDTPAPTGRGYSIAATIVAALGLYQGAVPLVVRPLFGADQRFAPALWLRSPWWWVACIGIVVATLLALAWLDAARPPATTAPDAEDGGGDIPAGTGTVREGARSETAYDGVAGLVFLVGIYNGVAPFVVRLLGGDRLLLAFPLRLPAPWWWIASLVVLVATVAALVVIDHVKGRDRHVDDPAR